MFAAADPYNNIHKKPPGASKRLAPILEGRAAEPQQQAIRTQVFDAVLRSMPAGLTVVDIGCGTGAIARDLAQRPNISSVIGVDPAPFLVEEAQRLAAKDPHRSKLSFRQGLGGELPLGTASAHVAIIWTVLCHVPTADIAQILKDTRRVLKPGGRVVVADNDLSGWSVAMGEHDPLSPPLAWFVRAYIQDPWLCKRFPSLLAAAGFSAGPLQLHTVVEVRARTPAPAWYTCAHATQTTSHAAACGPCMLRGRRPRTHTGTSTSYSRRLKPLRRAVPPAPSLLLA